jgi:inositol-phosphate phosphatase/L-galactose 1-phosphate phosphatase/histidinol-phosphatase
MYMKKHNPVDAPEAALALAMRMADEVGHIARRYFRTRPEVTSKEDESPVTIADREIEMVLRDRIRAAFPDHGIRGEEYANHQPTADWCWHLDPIDGTKSFLSGSLCFGTQIALTYLGRPVLGLIDQPITGERWISENGRATRLNHETAKTSPCEDLANAVMYTSDPYLFSDENAEKFATLRRSVLLTRYSHDCYAAGLLAIGQIDLLVETGVQAYDIAAQIPVIQGAGGIVSDWSGNPPQLEHQGEFLAAATSQLHARALAILRGISSS